MRRAARFDNKEVNKALNEVDTTATRAVRRTFGRAAHFMKNYNNKSVTENGAVGYKTTTHPLLDMNFKVSSFRNWKEEDITKLFVTAYYEDRVHAVKWLFYLRDVLEGLGERRTFRACLAYLIHSHPDVATAVMPLIPEYGRYDDLMIYVDSPLCRQACAFMKKQLNKDLVAMKEGLPVSLLAKWLPSNNTSSQETRRLARIITKNFGMTEREYRKTLSSLRRYLDVVEVKISASEWAKVNYESLPAKANMKYESAFVRHDKERRCDYLLETFLGNSKINANGLAPHEIVHRIVGDRSSYSGFKDDLLAEALWKHIRDNGYVNEWGLDNCIVVADGSGSMYSCVTGNTKVRAIEVCNALAIYFAEQLKGVFHNQVITFSENPQYVDLTPGTSLKERLEIMYAHDEVANTNVEAVFDMILDMAVSNQVPTEELPKQVLLISDMEFDQATRNEYYSWETRKFVVTRPSFSQALFDVIEKRYHDKGYAMPRLIFWNVCGRSDTIPNVEGESGICLLSGFSQNAMKVASHTGIKDPYKALIKTLDAPRYDKVQEVLDHLQLALI